MGCRVVGRSWTGAGSSVVRFCIFMYAVMLRPMAMAVDDAFAIVARPTFDADHGFMVAHTMTETSAVPLQGGFFFTRVKLNPATTTTTLSTMTSHLVLSAVGESLRDFAVAAATVEGPRAAAAAASQPLPSSASHVRLT